MFANLFKRIKSSTQKVYWREIFACLLLVIGIYFLRKQRHEVQAILPYLKNSKQVWLLASLGVSVLYLFFQAGMYVNSFLAVNARVRWMQAMELFLKRYLLSIFLPGGGVTALTYTPDSVKSSVTESVKIHRASGLFAFGGILSTFLIGLPMIFTNLGKVNSSKSTTGLIVIAVLLTVLVGLFRTIRQKGPVYNALYKRFPKTMEKLFQFTDASIDVKRLAAVVAFSIGVETCGIIHLYLAMLAIGAVPNLLAAGLAYIITLLLMAASPFLKGLGAVELSMIYVLGQYGYTPVQALSITVIYRVFEFWLPMIGGVFAFLYKGKEVFLRIFPALSIFLLGIINILSIVESPITEHISWAGAYFPEGTLESTSTLVVFVGLTLIVTAEFLMKGFRNAWWLALVICGFSIVANLIKEDYTKTVVAAIVFLILLFTGKRYTLKGDSGNVNKGLQVVFVSFLAIFVYSITGFYFLEKRHFGMQFTLEESAVYSLKALLLLKINELKPLTRFGQDFLRSLYVLGLFAWSFLFYALFRGPSRKLRKSFLK